MDLPSAVALTLLPGLARFRAVDVARQLAAAGSLSLDAVVEVLVPEAAARPSTAALCAAAGRAIARRRAAGLIPLAWTDPGYPASLLTTTDPPAVLWVRGEIGALHRPAVALVGARAATPAALETAAELAHDLAEAGLVIVSGLARGVDAEAHRGALATGLTVAVLGCGADRVYPPEHDGLAGRVASSGGALVSELPPGAAPHAHHFPLRNRLISGLSRAVVVVEASERSGSLITARLALEQGREVMAVPGSVAGGRNRGAHALLRDGAVLVDGADDVLEALGLRRAAMPEAGAPDEAPDDPVLERLPAGEPVDLERLMADTGLAAPPLLQRLLELELAGRVVRAPAGRFLRVKGKW